MPKATFAELNIRIFARNPKERHGRNVEVTKVAMLMIPRAYGDFENLGVVFLTFVRNQDAMSDADWKPAAPMKSFDHMP